MSCLFCDMEKMNYIGENDLAYAIFDKFPVNQGHALIIPKRHFESYFDMTEEELVSINRLIKEVKIQIDHKFNPDGYNIGVNIGETAGQTIFHLHFHLIPRYSGDVEKPIGGIRNFKESLVPYK
ncbi:HIT family protein [Alkalicella caledoniensis]|uniref:HIT family protein n=1 Tax=Alkalicella caledoniensis TaxID=2731377 RepID=A0A7G9W5Y4_ALKCA|nr:HIT family protein [Alkalicella caledoniensis]QNO14096.1 HIT family protein [Alkalicella caledoniensis]